MENGNTIGQADYEEAEQKDFENYERAVARQLGIAARRAFSGERKIIEEQTPTEESKTEGEESEIEQDGKINWGAAIRNRNTESNFGILPLTDIAEEGDIDFGIEDTSDEIEQMSKREEVALKAMRELIWRNLHAAVRERTEIKNRETLARIGFDAASGKASTFEARGESKRYFNREKLTAREAMEELAETTPESYIYVHGSELREHIKQHRSGEMITTPYVTSHLERVEGNIRSGIPTFIHGHLGSGKTELAINAARNTMIDKCVESTVVGVYSRWRKKNPDAPIEECRDQLLQLYKGCREYIETAIENGEKDVVELCRPYVISASETTNGQDFFVDKTLVLSQADNKTLQEHKKAVDEALEEWKRNNPEKAEDKDELRMASQQILKFYTDKNRAFGTTVETVQKEVLRGVLEGKPVIIDEANAIPAAVLISLNDILQRRPGERCYIPGHGNTVIKPGFALIMTGNLSSGSTEYVGRKTLDPAFRSRVDSIEYDYLPMSIDDKSFDDTVDPENGPRKNELFHVVVSKLCDQKGRLKLPEMDKNLGALFRLCKLARKTQLVFEGKWKEKSPIKTRSNQNLKVELNNAVLSVRNLLNVLERWDKGCAGIDLDEALWEGFIGSIHDGDDQNLILALARQEGFFSSDDGWNIEIEEKGCGLKQYSDVHPGEKIFYSEPLESRSLRKVVQMLYGPGPERDAYPDEIDIEEVEEEANDEISFEDLEEYEKQLEIVDKTIAALEALGEKCGCSINSAEEG